jgi:hypothetical protein
MNAFRITRWCMLTALVALGTTIGFSQYVAAQQAAVQDGVEVLTRGPVHEAFAETITFDPEPGIVAPKSPPDPIEEVSPDQRPEGANVTWIPGYWAWDDERSDFLWVSGIWRSLPPGRQWVPGYWGKAQQGFQWTSGYWADATSSAIDYLPEPPATVEVGPNVAAPSADDMWLPGCWIWQQNRYAWRPGYWTRGNQNWDWVPDHYVWTPSGYVFVDGYWDYSVGRRGVLFAPVYFNSGVYAQSGFSYSPSVVINPGAFVRHLFVRPGYGHYYFGDYYGSNYASAGFSPWFSLHSSRRGYDPIYANQRWQHRNDREWEQHAEANFHNLRDNENARPPRNWAAQRELMGRGDVTDRRNIAVAAPLDELAQRRNSRLRLQPVDPAERQQYGQRTHEYRTYLQQRQQLEADAARTPGGEPAAATKPVRRTFSRSPFVAPPAEQLGRDYTPPQRHQAPTPDLQVQPQFRTHGGQTGVRQGFGQGTAGGPAGQIQAGPQGQPQRQGMSQGNLQGPPAGQPQRQGMSQGNRQGPSAGQSQGQGGNFGGGHQGPPAGQSQGQGANQGGGHQGPSSGHQQQNKSED